jgi:hypothetical protein
MHRLLILACSQKKASIKGRIRAIDRYDGPAFRVLRKYLREEADEELCILILSAKYGLIDFQHKIPYYEQRLSKASATKLRPRVLKAASRILRSRRWRTIGLSAGREYVFMLEGIEKLIPRGASLNLLAGGLGKRLSSLRNWLRH